MRKNSIEFFHIPFKSTSFFDEKYYTENQAGRQIYFVM